MKSHVVQVSFGGGKKETMRSIEAQRETADELVCEQSQASLAAHET